MSSWQMTHNHRNMLFLSIHSRSWICITPILTWRPWTRSKRRAGRTTYAAAAAEIGFKIEHEVEVAQYSIGFWTEYSLTVLRRRTQQASNTGCWSGWRNGTVSFGCIDPASWIFQYFSISVNILKYHISASFCQPGILQGCLCICCGPECCSRRGHRRLPKSHHTRPGSSWIGFKLKKKSYAHVYCPCCINK